MSKWIFAYIEYLHISFSEKFKNSYKTFCVRPECVRDDVRFVLLRGTPSRHTHTHTHTHTNVPWRIYTYAMIDWRLCPDSFSVPRAMTGRVRGRWCATGPAIPAPVPSLRPTRRLPAAYRPTLPQSWPNLTAALRYHTRPRETVCEREGARERWDERAREGERGREGVRKREGGSVRERRQGIANQMRANTKQMRANTKDESIERIMSHISYDMSRI